MTLHNDKFVFIGLQGMVSDCPEIRRVVSALVCKMVDQTSQKYSAKDIGYILSGINGLHQLNIPEVSELVEELIIKVNESDFKGQPNLLFLQFGKSIRVKTGLSSAMNTESLLYSMDNNK